jgi:hypothetical protein
MKPWMNKVLDCIAPMLAIAAIVVVQACGRRSGPEESCHFVQNSKSQRVSWRETLPVDLYLDPSVPTEFVPSIQKAIGVWNAAGQLKLGKDYFRLQVGNKGSSKPSQDGVSKIYFLNDWDTTRTTEQARTTIYWLGNRIYEADVRVNDKDFDFFTTVDSVTTAGSATATRTQVHMESLVVHELGHVLGLAHNEASGSVMQANLGFGSVREAPVTVDLNSVSCEYEK